MFVKFSGQNFIIDSPNFRLYSYITEVCLFFSSGLDYVVTKGSEYDFWQEGAYNAHEHIYRCFAYKAYSNDFIKMAQGTVYILGQ